MGGGDSSRNLRNVNYIFKAILTPQELSSGSDSARDVAFMKKSRLRKLTWKLLVVYLAAILLVGIADPDPAKYLRWWFWPAINMEPAVAEIGLQREHYCSASRP